MSGPLLDFAQAAERLNVRESWLRDKVRFRQVPHTRLGRHVRFTEADLDAITRAAAVPAVTASPRPARRRHLRAANP